MVSDSSNISRRHSRNVIVQAESDSTVTYHLDKNSNNDEYDGTITVTPEEKSDHTYIVYKHTLVKSLNIKSTKISYNNKYITIVQNTAIAKKRDKLDSLESNVFSEICTYSLKTDANYHLLLKLTTNIGSVFYFYRFGKDGTKWRQLGPKELVEFSVISNEEFKTIETQLDRDGLESLINKLIVDNNNNIKLLLEKISFDVNSIVALVENKNLYQEDEINSVLGPEQIPSIASNYRIFVNEETKDGLNNCIKKQGYRIYKQHLQEQATEWSDKARAKNLYIRLYLFKNKIQLYDNTTGDEKLALIKYDSENKYLSVFFYDDDPRPIMICFGNDAFRPLNLENYFHKWVKAGDIGQCDCKGDREDETKLLRVLAEIVYLMNPVEIKHGLERDKKSSTYITQKFKNNKKEISIKIGLYPWDLNCYRGYEHEFGRPGYALGEISYNANKLFQDYDEYSKTADKNHVFPDKLMAYYYMYDKDHEYPLLIELKYDNEEIYSSYNSDYYKLTIKDSIKKWNKMYESSGESDKIFIRDIKRIRNEMNKEMEKMMQSAFSEESYEENEMETMSFGKEERLTYVLEGKLDEIRNELKIEYIISEENLIMSPNNCTKNNSGAIAGTVTTLGLVGTGGGILFYKYKEVIISYFRGLFN